MAHAGNEINMKVVSAEFNLLSVPTDATTKGVESRAECSAGREQVGSGVS